MTSVPGTSPRGVCPEIIPDPRVTICSETKTSVPEIRYPYRNFTSLGTPLSIETFHPIVTSPSSSIAITSANMLCSGATSTEKVPFNPSSTIPSEERIIQ